MVTPTPKQTAFLLVPHREVLFGGAAGGGKSIGVLAAASQYVDVPGYKALILRQTYLDLALPEALMDVAMQWWKNTDAHWNSSKYVWTFPSGATITFGYLEREPDKYRYQGSAFQFIGFDELTQFETESRYLYLFSRMRRIEGFPVPLRVRSATNPGGIGHEWVKRRFITNPTPDRIFIPSSLDDNPYLDKEEYEKALNELDPITREQLKEGNWEVDPRGGLFKRHWFKLIEAHEIPETVLDVRYWDLAATTEDEASDPDWTVGTRMGVTAEGRYVVKDVIRLRATPLQVEKTVAETAAKDGHHVFIYMAQDPGQAGKSQISHYRLNVVPGYSFHPDKDYRTTNKTIRSKPLSKDAENGHVAVKIGPYLTSWLDEYVIFDDGAHDDQVDSGVGAHAMLNKLLRGGARSHKGRQGYREKKRKKVRT